MTDAFYISRQAESGLRKLAIQQNYVDSDALTAKGMSEFIERLSDQTFKDTRPSYIKDQDDDLISAKRVPIWNSEQVRSVFRLDLTNKALYNFCVWALAYNITMGARYKGGPRHLSMTSIAGAVIEAIGLGWLTPTELPLRQRKRKPYTIAKGKEWDLLNA